MLIGFPRLLWGDTASQMPRRARPGNHVFARGCAASKTPTTIASSTSVYRCVVEIEACPSNS